MITLDKTAATPAFDQIREQVVGLIRIGELQPGHRLPSIRQLAGDLGIAPGTVARAYSELETGGLISSSRAGTVIRGGQAAPAQIKAAAGQLATSSRSAGLTIEDAIAALRACW
jgi:GntR family transcriptional regulator